MRKGIEATASPSRTEPASASTRAPQFEPIVTRRLSEITPQRLEWLWRGHFPLGKLSLLSGDPGLGKSLVTLALAATVSRGAPWPIPGDGNAPLGDVLLISAEDDAADTIRPRLEAVGADLHRVHIVDGVPAVDNSGRPYTRTWTLADLPELDAKLAELPECRLLIIDPVSAYLAGTDSHKNADVRSLLAPLTELAGHHRVAIVAVSHLNKSAGPAMYRTTGSLAFVAAARAVYAVTKDKEDPSRRFVLPIKANLAPDNGGLAYCVAVVDGQPVVEWERAPVVVDVDEAISRDQTGGDHTERDNAAGWLRDLLADGPMAANEVKAQAKDAGYAWATVRRAKYALGIKPTKTRFGGGWEWIIPPKVLTKDEDAHQKKVSTLGEGEHLGAAFAAHSDHLEPAATAPGPDREGAEI